jgi:hypothetical protein
MRWGLLILVLAVAGCAANQTGGKLPLPAEPVAVSPRQGGTVPATRTFSEVQVRAFLTDETGARREVGGAECSLEAPSYQARFASPGRVLVPVPRSGAPAIEVACRANGLSGGARRGVVRDWGARGWDYGPWYDPFWGPRWPGDPFWGAPRSGVSVGLAVGDPGWGWGPPWPRGRVAPFYPDVEVDLR